MGIESKVPLPHAALPSRFPGHLPLYSFFPLSFYPPVHMSVSSIHPFIILLVCNPLWSSPGITRNGSPRSEGRENGRKRQLLQVGRWQVY